jgi:hypothetical protein
MIAVRKSFLILFASLVVVGSIGSACVAAGGVADIVLGANQITGLRSFGSTTAGAFLLDFQAVKAGTEDRVVAHFNLNSVTSDLNSAELRIPLAIWDPGPPLGTFGVYSFYGDGVVSPDEWAAGTLLQQFTNIDGNSSITLRVDVTSAIKSGLTQGKPYLSFNFRGGPAFDRYFMGSIVGLPDSSILLHYVPEPNSLAIGSVALMVCALKTSRTRRRP